MFANYSRRPTSPLAQQYCFPKQKERTYKRDGVRLLEEHCPANTQQRQCAVAVGLVPLGVPCALVALALVVPVELAVELLAEQTVANMLQMHLYNAESVLVTDKSDMSGESFYCLDLQEGLGSSRSSVSRQTDHCDRLSPWCTLRDEIL